MFSLIRLSRNKLPAVIAIIAILLLFIAPEVSKTLEHRRMENWDEHASLLSSASPHQMIDRDMKDGSDGKSDMMEGMEMSTSDMQLHHAMRFSGQQSASIPDMPTMVHGDMMDELVCGYCVMLIHLPLMLWIFVAIIWLTMILARAPTPRLILQSFTIYFTGIAQPRAPPVYSFLVR